MKRQWKITESDPETVQSFCQALNIHRVTATVLYNRQINTLEKARCFLTPSLKELNAADTIKGIQTASERIESALLNKEHIMIFGDYDVDGITATCLLYTFLKRAGAKISYYIPHRINEGYGFQSAHIEKVALKRAVSLIITVDCGSTSFDAITQAKKSGIDVIVTDHHNISKEIPEAVAVINPKQSSNGYDFTNLAGVGVAFYLLVHLRKHLREKNFWKRRPEPNLKDYLDIVTLGTIADIVPLTGENRILTKFGLGIINKRLRPGLNALIEVSGINNASVTSEDIAFRLAPRLNAAGRIGHARSALELLLSQKTADAKKIAKTLNETNIQRQQIEEGILNQIEKRVALPEDPSAPLKPIILSDPSWHEGVLGIVASRLVKAFNTPTLLLCGKGEILKGSARSVKGFDIHNGLSASKEFLLSFGGHALAAGLSLKKENFNAFKQHFEAVTRKMMADTVQSKVIGMDCRLNLKEISSQLLEELENLQPYGQNVPPPLFMGEDIQVLSSSIVGKKHRRMVLRQVGDVGSGIPAIQFNIDPDETFIPHFHKIAYRIQWNRFNGKKTAQVIIEES